MGNEKKKWYQKGEFEDGYQFGDIFRTVKNSISGKKEEEKKNVEQKREAIDLNSTVSAVKDGRLDFDLDAQMYGFANSKERKEYIEQNPELYVSMGGYKYVPAGTPLRNTESITKSNEAIRRIVERFKNTDVNKVQEAINAVGSGEWLDKNTIKKHKNTINSYVKDYISLEKLGYFDSLPKENRTEYSQTLKRVKELVNSQNGQKNGYFQKGALEDGDVGTAYTASVKDVETDVGAGFLGIGEKFLDWFVSSTNASVQQDMIQQQAGMLFADRLTGGKQTEKYQAAIEENERLTAELKNKTEEFVKKDLYDEHEIAKKIVAGSYAPSRAFQNGDLSIEGHKKAYEEELDYINNDMEDDSVFAEKSDALAETTGHYIGQIVLSKVGVPWYLTAYTTGAGGETENALNQGATLDEAVASGAWAGGGEVASELMFGGPLSKTGLDDVISKKIGSQFTNTFMRGLSKYGIKAIGEGVEEPVASVFSRFGQWLTYQDDKTLKEMLWSEEAREEYVDSFIGGVFFGGIGQTGEVIKSKVHGVDYVTGLTKSELKVVDEAYKDAVFEVTKSGKELTHKEKVQIYDDAIQRVKSGKADTQTIEAALGGEDYSAYKNALDNYNTLQQKLNEIKTADSSAKIQEQAAGEIKQRLEQVKLQADKLKNILENKVAQKIDVDNIHLKDRESYLWDSYIKSLPKITNNILYDIRPIENIDENAVVDGIWEDSPNKSKNIVEKSQLKSVENAKENGIIEETVDNDTGIPGKYTDEIVWSIYKHVLVRKFGKGYFGKRIKQHISRVDNYELKINPNNESYYLQHPDGRYVQFENMVDNVLQDGKCILNKKRSFYHVYDRGYKAQKRVLEQANRQIETANAVGYKVEWLVSDEKAVEQISRLFKENNINIIVKFYQE